MDVHLLKMYVGSYKILTPIRFNYSDKYWDLFSDDSGKGECALELELKAAERDSNSIEQIPVEENGRVFRSNGAVLSINGDFTKGTIISEPENDRGIYGCAMVALYGNLIRKETVVLHSSLVDFNGRGIIFTGPSGIGKTTQAMLWEKYAGAEIINGDMVIIHKEEDGRFYGCGSPWHGSSEFCLNKKVPIEAIFCLEQSASSRISEIPMPEIISRVFKETLLPDWFDGCRLMGLETVDKLLRSVPVYRLDATKDVNAVNAVRKMLNL